MCRAAIVGSRKPPADILDDLGSPNGAFVNGERIGTATRVLPSDVIIASSLEDSRSLIMLLPSSVTILVSRLWKCLSFDIWEPKDARVRVEKTKSAKTCPFCCAGCTVRVSIGRQVNTWCDFRSPTLLQVGKPFPE